MTVARKTRFVVAVGALATLGMGAAPAAAKSKAPHHSTTSPKLAQEGYGTFWECPAKTTSFLVAVNRLDLHPGQTLNVDFIVKNLSTTACNYVAPYAGAVPGPTAATLQIGPCGSMGFEIEGAHHRDVWPGVEPFNCPALGFAQLQPNGTVVGSGSWAQSRPTGLHRVSTGSYTLVVDGHFSFPLKIEAH
jgi:hypothetical protein